MENPWKKKSKINPQKEDGHREIENKLFRALLKQKMTGSEWAICMAVIDKTYGYGKKFDQISYGCLSQLTEFNRQTVIKAVKSLELRRILVVNHRLPINQILFNKHYDTWVVNQRRLVNHRLPTSKPQTTKTSKLQTTHKRNKDIYIKKNILTAIEIYENHPRKGAREQAIKNIVTLLNKGIPPENLRKAQENYIAEIKRKDTEKDFIIQANNFFGQAQRWRDFVNIKETEDEKALRDFERFQKEIRAKKGIGKGDSS